MGGRHHGHQSRIRYLQFADPVGNRQADQVELGGNLLGHLPQNLGRARVPFVSQGVNLTPMVNAAHIAAESHHSTGSRICDQRLHQTGVKGLLSDLNEPNYIHGTIIRGSVCNRASDRRK